MKFGLDKNFNLNQFQKQNITRNAEAEKRQRNLTVETAETVRGLDVFALFGTLM